MLSWNKSQELCDSNDIEFKTWLKNYKDSHFQDQPKRWEVLKYLLDKYSQTHYFPGIDYLKWLTENKTKVPVETASTKYFFLPGCYFYDVDGFLNILNVANMGNEARSHFFDLNGNWGDSNEVVLFKR